MIRVAVASSDGKVVNQHFGRAKQFLIFEIVEDHFQFLEIRYTSPACTGQDHREGQMSQTIEMLADCRAVFVSQIGPGASEKLLAKGIVPYRIANFIEEAIKEWMVIEGLSFD
ncbi:NifB/NifX family molybdenum-iron cluster-binding protein [Heliorestis convoluta]|uniref:Dinitrogenase iron-molybdenum cofactor biosynthesis protein n=1 Tax=Heliorestis convoluta TaxID=356322 RepID=A0A5Q2MYW8_9FIRM|nr:NifB/NifX family molybdenum-iron cluster-binding protein [Heliorestis convoluta]QGG48154.1 Dinitrogenase iron-molybdenum cofactor biosynthesis protein [Heliorestis convoluta]